MSWGQLAELQGVDGGIHPSQNTQHGTTTVAPSTSYKKKTKISTRRSQVWFLFLTPASTSSKVLRYFYKASFPTLFDNLVTVLLDLSLGLQKSSGREKEKSPAPCVVSQFPANTSGLQSVHIYAWRTFEFWLYDIFRAKELFIRILTFFLLLPNSRKSLSFTATPLWKAKRRTWIKTSNCTCATVQKCHFISTHTLLGNSKWMY